MGKEIKLGEIGGTKYKRGKLIEEMLIPQRIQNYKEKLFRFHFREPTSVIYHHSGYSAVE